MRRGHLLNEDRPQRVFGIRCQAVFCQSGHRTKGLPPEKGNRVFDVLPYIVPFTRYPYEGEQVACDLCGCADHITVCDHDRRLKKLQTVACAQCGLMRTNPMPSEPEIIDYYKNLYRLDYGMTSTKPSRRHLNRSHKQAADRLALLAPVLSEPSKILDFGSGAGVFLHHAKQAGHEVTGIEPGKQFAQFAASEYGVDVINEVWEKIDLPGKYDVITTVEVIEHLRRPVLALRWLADALVEDGVIYVTVPDMSPNDRETFRRFHFAHLYQFTPQTLIWAAARAGLEPDPRFQPYRTQIVFRKKKTAAVIPSFPAKLGHETAKLYPKSSVARYILSLRWLSSLGFRLKKTFRDTFV